MEVEVLDVMRALYSNTFYAVITVINGGGDEGALVDEDDRP